jgi:hypothetical protein
MFERKNELYEFELKNRLGTHLPASIVSGDISAAETKGVIIPYMQDTFKSDILKKKPGAIMLDIECNGQIQTHIVMDRMAAADSVLKAMKTIIGYSSTRFALNSIAIPPLGTKLAGGNMSPWQSALLMLSALDGMMGCKLKFVMPKNAHTAYNEFLRIAQSDVWKSDAVKDIKAYVADFQPAPLDFVKVFSDAKKYLNR